MSKGLWKLKMPKNLVHLCDCGRPTTRKSFNGSFVCERCARIEERPHDYNKEVVGHGYSPEYRVLGAGTMCFR